MWLENVSVLKNILESLMVYNSHGDLLDTDRAFDAWIDMTMEIKDKQKTIYLVGNGASASMASHIATDLLKNAHIKAMVFTDMSLITAVSNDISFQDSFAEPLKRYITDGDMLVCISSSGRSRNILEAAKIIEKYKSYIITLSAMDIENPLRTTGDINFYIPASTYGLAETGHTAILHYWIDRILLKIKDTEG